MSVAQALMPSSLDQAWEGVFPLPLTPMEAFLVADGRPGYTMMADIQLHFVGTLDRELFELALQDALVRNPLYRCLVARDPRLGQVWLPTTRMPSIDWAPHGTPLDERYDALVDLATDIGLRIWVRQDAKRSTVLLHFHHACADALGTFAFVEDFLAAYAMLCPGGQVVARRPLDPSRLRRRGLASIPKRNWHQQIFDLFFGGREALRFFLQGSLPPMGRR